MDSSVECHTQPRTGLVSGAALAGSGKVMGIIQRWGGKVDSIPIAGYASTAHLGLSGALAMPLNVAPCVVG